MYLKMVLFLANEGIISIGEIKALVGVDAIARQWTGYETDKVMIKFHLFPTIIITIVK